MNKQELNTYTKLAFGGLVLSVLLAACGETQFQLKDMTKVKILDADKANKDKIKDQKEKDLANKLNGAGIGTTPAAGSLGSSLGTSGSLATGKPQSTLGSLGTSSSAGSLGTASAATAGSLGTATTAGSLGTAQSIVEVKLDDKGQTVLSLKKSYSLDLRGEMAAFVIHDRQIKIETEDEKKVNVDLSLELGGKKIDIKDLMHSKKRYLDMRSLNLYKTNKGDDVTVYVNSFCRLSSEVESENDNDCKKQILIIHILLENGDRDKDMVKQVGVVFSEKSAEPILVIDSDGDEQLDMTDFEKLLRQKL